MQKLTLAQEQYVQERIQKSTYIFTVMMMSSDQFDEFLASLSLEEKKQLRYDLTAQHLASEMDGRIPSKIADSQNEIFHKNFRKLLK